MTTVTISFSSQDRLFVQELCEELESRGVDAWHYGESHASRIHLRPSLMLVARARAPDLAGLDDRKHIGFPVVVRRARQ